jgi:hypothetical protein
MGYKHDAFDTYGAEEQITVPAFMLRAAPGYHRAPRDLELVRTEITDVAVKAACTGPAAAVPARPRPGQAGLRPTQGRHAMTHRFRTAAVIGAGTIGLSWTALFSGHGPTVRVSDPRPDLAEAIDTALVEVVPGERTTEQAGQAAVGFCTAVGRTPVAERREIPGLVGSRLQNALNRQAVHPVQQGVVTPEDRERVVQTVEKAYTSTPCTELAEARDRKQLAVLSAPEDTRRNQHHKEN